MGWWACSDTGTGRLAPSSPTRLVASVTPWRLATPVSIDFGAVRLGRSASIGLTLTNSGNSPLQGSATVAGADPKDFMPTATSTRSAVVIGRGLEIAGAGL